MANPDPNFLPDEIALKTFHEGAQRLQSEDQLSRYAQMLATLSIKLIHGLEGQEFKEGFLEGAIADTEKMTVQKVQ